MPNVIVEPDKEKGGYRAMENNRVIARGETQNEAGSKAHQIRPNNTIEAARVRTTEEGFPDEFRKMFGPKR